ncbi:MAG TPA: NAD-dependent epimerase/dehydratase family protein [Pyrinomonadaceae bacterium]
MRILVTGGSGYLGLHVRSFFNADDFSRRSHLDVLNPHDAAMVENYEVVIHLAALLDKDPAAAESCFRTNVEGTANLLKHMQPNSVFIYASTKDVYGAHADAYRETPETCSTDYCGQSALEWSKLIAERYVEYYARARGFRSCIFRLSNVYARPSDNNEAGFVTYYVESVKYGEPIHLPLEGKPVRDILHVDDFSRACRAFIDSNVTSGLYNLGGGIKNSATLRDIIGTIARVIECEAVIDEEKRLPAPVPVNYISDITRAREELGWQPAIEMEEGLQSVI